MEFSSILFMLPGGVDGEFLFKVFRISSGDNDKVLEIFGDYTTLCMWLMNELYILKWSHGNF